MEDHSILWRRIDTKGHEAARVYSDDEGHYLDGAAIFIHEGNPCRLEYLIECDTDWSTRSVTIDGWVGDEIIEIEILVGEGGVWYLNDDEKKDVEGCVDIDLNFSPITNLLPLRRLELKNGESKSVNAAWLRFPSFELERLNQTYTRLDDSMVKYESGDSDFVRKLKVNRAGLVVDYPDYWIAETSNE